MTVLGSGNDKSDDKEKLVGKGDVAMIMPNRHRLVKLKKKRSIITLILSIGFLFIFLCGVFLTVCFIKRIGPFRRHISGIYPVGSKRYNAQKVYESYEITDNYVFIHVPSFNTKHGSFDSVQTLHVLDKNLTVIQHRGMCLVKPWHGHRMLRDDWLLKIRNRSAHKHHIPSRFVPNHLRMEKSQLPENFLRDSVHNLADAICYSRPVFRVMAIVNYRPIPTCYVRCNGCLAQSFTWQIIGGRRCRVCNCGLQGEMTKPAPRLRSSNQVDANCNSVRCEDKCTNSKLFGCFQCRCEDKKPVQEEKTRIKPVINKLKLNNFIVEAEADREKRDTTDVPILREREQFGPIFAKGGTEPPTSNERMKFEPVFDYVSKERNKRSAEPECSETARIYEGYSPLDNENEVPVDYIYTC